MFCTKYLLSSLTSVPYKLVVDTLYRSFFPLIPFGGGFVVCTLSSDNFLISSYGKTTIIFEQFYETKQTYF